MSGAKASFVVMDRRGGFRVNWRVAAPESWFTTTRLLDSLVRLRPYAHGRMLDIGCGVKPYRALFRSFVDTHIGLDVPQSMHGAHVIDAFASSLDLPCKTGVFDTVLCTEVLEHVPDAGRALNEICRVLKPGGHAIVTTPFLYRVHEAPYDFQRLTQFGLERLASDAGLEAKEFLWRGGYFSVAFDVLLKGLAQGVCAINMVYKKVMPGRRHLIETTPVRLAFYLFQTMAMILLRRENVNCRVYTLGFACAFQKPASSAVKS